MTPRERVERVLHWQSAGAVPFTMYEAKVLPGAAERAMRNRGMCIVDRRVPAVHTHRPNTRVHKEVTYKDGAQLTRTTYETPAGTLSTVTQAAGFTFWRHEHLFKSTDDYKALLAYVQDAQYEPNYEPLVAAAKANGGDAILRVGIGLEPLQSLISGDMMAMQTFCLEWMDHRDEILKLYHAIAESHRQLYPLIAKAPVLHANYGGNVTPDIVSPAMFEQYYMPHYAEAAEALHREGKLIGVHFDANCRALSPLIAQTPLDYVEAFTPAPGTDMTLAQARQAWPDKIIWMNFPSSVHLRSNEVVAATTYDLLEQVVAPDGLIMGITEDMPPDRWQESCTAIMDGLERHARERGYDHEQ